MLERIYRIDGLLANRRSVSRRELELTLGVSWATLKRDLSYMRDRLHAPIVFDRELRGYRFDTRGNPSGPSYALPAFWFSAEELHALLTMQHLLSNLDPGGVLGPHIAPLLSRLEGLLEKTRDSAEAIHQRIRIETVGARRFKLTRFDLLGAALMRRQRLLITYHARSRDETLCREISPQRLRYYRENWYLEAWCHHREGIRAFAVDSIEAVEGLERPALEVPFAQLDLERDQGYGLFAGRALHWAHLRFSPRKSRWVAFEQWHPDQQGVLLADGTYETRIPYTDDLELVMDILKHGAECKVLAPPDLIHKIKIHLEAALAQYRTEQGGASPP